MNKSGDKHMNIFQAYTQQSEHPIENNLSRGLAIILQESPALFMRFIAKLNTQAQCIPWKKYNNRRGLISICEMFSFPTRRSLDL